MQILITIPAESIYGVAHALAAHNESSESPLGSNEAYVQYVLGRAVESWCAQANIVPPLPVDPVILDGVPQEVTRRQGIQALINTGKLALVQPAIDAIPDAGMRATMQNEWDNSLSFLRQRPSLIALATQGLGMTLADLDALFILAATL